ncbi:unnamed protein product [Blepharisma stoltei]|uniref:SIN1-type PH domain-containing protein n=1 Tax=Blepharisma stoltei TaxID=1481888 RepID=A0AAU9JW74_9CILI|nr:unnamed protein product [Blepharisma stoltei]
MEFSETFELLQMLKGPKSHDQPNILSCRSDRFSDCAEKMIHYSQLETEILGQSPLNCFATSSQSTQGDTYSDGNFNEPESPITNFTESKEESNNYQNHEEIVKTFQMVGKSNIALNYECSELVMLKVYLFSLYDYIEISLPRTNTIGQLIGKILAAYKQDIAREIPLPSGAIPEAYGIWVISGENVSNEISLMLDRSSKVSDCSNSNLIFCNIPGFKNKIRRSTVLLSSKNISGVSLKINYEGFCVPVYVGPNVTLKNLLQTLERKFPERGYYNPDEYEFKISVPIEFSIRKEECIVDMNFTVSTLRTNELWLCKKNYKDSPIISEPAKKIHSEITKEHEEDHENYKPSMFNMSKSQACAYKEYIVIKVNKWGRKQKRILGIDQLRLYNMTESQAKQAIKQHALTSSAKNVLFMKFQGLYKSVTHHPEIPISSIQRIDQDHSNLACFHIEYIEDNELKRKLYETESSAIASEIIAKILKIMSMNAADNQWHGD